MNRIDSLRIKGFRSLADVELRDLPDATILIGANGSGKSNIVRFFEMVSWMTGDCHRLNEFVQLHGGADDQLFGGVKITPTMEAEIRIRTEAGRNDYKFALAYAHTDRFIFKEEAFRFTGRNWPADARWAQLGGDHTEARLVNRKSRDVAGVNPRTARSVARLLGRCVAYQFHDTSYSSPMKTKSDIEDYSRLSPHGGNLAAVLFHLQHTHRREFEAICDTIGRILPMFDRFAIEEKFDKVMLAWKMRGMNKTIRAHLTSDGSLRFFALATLLNLPPEMLPDVLLVDEPELGLHPTAIALLGGMIRSLSVDRQIIVATQSPLLVDCFDLDNIRVLDLQDGKTTIRHLDGCDLQHWLDDYTTGEVWQKNLIGGKP